MGSADTPSVDDHIIFEQLVLSSKGGEKFHSWWYGMVLKSRHIKDLFKPASGLVIELYRNNLFDPINIGNFAATFAYRNFFSNFGPFLEKWGSSSRWLI